MFDGACLVFYFPTILCWMLALLCGLWVVAQPDYRAGKYDHAYYSTIATILLLCVLGLWSLWRASNWSYT